MIHPLNEASRIYLDHNATTPFSKEIVEKVGVWLSESSWGNPSSIHWDGRKPKSLMREARKSLASLINGHPLEIIFTSGGSEANNLAIKGSFFSNQNESKNRYLVSAVEHPSVKKAFDFLKAQGAKVDVIPVSKNGEVDLEAYGALLDESVALVSMMYANNETGNIYPIQKMAKMAHEVGARFHCDAVQALGKAVVDVKKWDVDFASFSGHKFYSLKGSGFLYAKKGNHIDSLIHGGGQERGRRAGTENVLAQASFGHVAQLCAKDIELVAGKTKELRDQLEMMILSKIPRVSINGQSCKRLPNTSSMVIDGVDGETLLMNLDLKGVSVSTGAACSAGNPEPSPVLLAMGLSLDEAQSSLRLSLGWGTTADEIERFVGILVEVVERLRSFKEESFGEPVSDRI